MKRHCEGDSPKQPQYLEIAEFIPSEIASASPRNDERGTKARNDNVKTLRSIALIIIIVSVLIGYGLLIDSLSAQVQEDTLAISQYTITYSRYRDVSSLEQNLNFGKRQNERLTFSTNSSLSGNRNETLSRDQENRSIFLEAQYSFLPQLKMGINTQGSTTSDQGASYKNKNMRNILSTSFTFTPWQNFTFFKAEGIVLDRYQRTSPALSDYDQKNEGRTSELSAQLKFNLSQTPISLSYRESKQAQEMTFNQNQTWSTSGEASFGSGKLSLEGGANRIRQSYPLEGEVEETKKFRQEYATATYDLTPWTNLQGTFVTSLSRSEARYEASDLNPDSPLKNNRVEGGYFTSIIRYTPQENLNFMIHLKRAQLKSTYGMSFNDETSDLKDFKVSLFYKLKSGGSLDFVRSLRLTTYDFSHPYNFNTRDILMEETSVRFIFPLSFRTKLSTLLGVKEDHLVYIPREMSANNKKTSSYELAPTLEFNPFSFLNLSQSFSLKADYVVYDFVRDKSMLLRTEVISTKARFFRMGKPILNFEHTFLSQDQGGYIYQDITRTWGYRKEQRRDQHTLNLSFFIQPTTYLTFSPRYGIQSIQRWEYRFDSGLNGMRKFELSKTIQQDFAFRTDWKIGQHSSLATFLAKTLRKDEESYWEIKISLNYVL